MNSRTKRRRRTATKKSIRLSKTDPKIPQIAFPGFDVPGSAATANCCSIFNFSPQPTRESELKNTIKRLVDLI
jgi:hypothetical protein